MRPIARGWLAGTLAMALALVALVALVALAGPKPAAAQVGECFVGSTAPVLNGACLGAGSLREAHERTEQLGFTWSEADPHEVGSVGLIHLQRGSLTWALETAGPYACLGVRTLSPRIWSRIYTSGKSPPSLEPLGSDPRAEHPNHAIGVVGVVAVVGELENVIANVEEQYPFRDNRWPIRFGRSFTIADLGAEAVEASVPTGGFVRLISPTSPMAPCRAWQSTGLGRWIGVVLESDDLAATAAYFTARNIPVHQTDRGAPALWLDPDDTGGLLVEFVGHGWRPRT